MRLLVTGPDGFVGSHLVHNLGAIPITSDVTDFEALYQEIRDKSEGQHFTLIHTAALTDVEYCEKNRADAFNVNVRGTDNVLASIPKTGKVILLSTCHVFSGKNYFPYSERHDPNACNWYGSTKYGAEALLATYRVPSVAVRLGKLYDGNTLQKILMTDEEVPTFLKRSFIHVGDVVNILGKIAELDFAALPLFKKFYRVLHLGHPTQNYDYATFYNLVRAKHNLAPLPKRTLYEQRDADRPLRAVLDSRKLRGLIAHQFRSL